MKVLWNLIKINECYNIKDETILGEPVLLRVRLGGLVVESSLCVLKVSASNPGRVKSKTVKLAPLFASPG